MSIRWYVGYALSYRDVEELMAERGLEIDHATIQRWVVKYSPKLEANFSKSFKKRLGKSWRMDETYSAPIFRKLQEVITETRARMEYIGFVIGMWMKRCLLLAMQ